jgi:F-type H+-transporting ATPase subunit b
MRLWKSFGRKSFDRTGAASLLMLAGAGPALAAEGGMPQLNFHDFAPQLVWLTISFVVLYVLMARVALPKVGKVLQMRAERIKDDLDRASSLKAETDQVIAAYEKALADARNHAAAVSRDTAAALAEKAAVRQAKVGADLSEKIRAAEASIAAARSRAMAEIQNVAADIAADATRRLVGLQVSPADAVLAAAAALKERG